MKAQTAPFTMYELQDTTITPVLVEKTSPQYVWVIHPWADGTHGTRGMKTPLWNGSRSYHPTEAEAIEARARTLTSEYQRHARSVLYHANLVDRTAAAMAAYGVPIPASPEAS